MKGVILAGGLGTRLAPLTRITNKHLLPVYNKPMILYAMDTLQKSGIKDIMIVCGREHAGHFMNFLGSGNEYGVRLSYAIQDKNNGGIADALRYAADFAEKESIAVILGDNIFEHDFTNDVRTFKRGAKIFLKEVPDPKRFGVPVFDRTQKRIIRIEEKPEKPKSNFAQTGFCIFDDHVFSIIKTLRPSQRGELELTDLNNVYLKKGSLSFAMVAGAWYDVGTFDSLLLAAIAIAKKHRDKNAVNTH